MYRWRYVRQMGIHSLRYCRLGPSMHVHILYSSLLLRPQPIHTPQERLCTVLSYYMLHDKQDHVILPRNVYVQFSLITIIANTSCPGTFMYITIIAYTSFSGTFMYTTVLSFNPMLIITVSAPHPFLCQTCVYIMDAS